MVKLLLPTKRSFMAVKLILNKIPNYFYLEKIGKKGNLISHKEKNYEKKK